MKKYVMVFLSAVLILSLVACSAEKNDPPISQQAVTQTEPPKSDEGDLGSYHVKISDAKIGSDNSDQKIISISYDFTNNSDDAQSADIVLYARAFQDGVEMTPVLICRDKSLYDNSLASKAIKPGITLTCQSAFYLSSDSDVEFEIVKAFSASDEIVYKVFSVNDIAPVSGQE